MRRRIPSLEALQAFEAAARHQSFTAAAAALALTQSAVCKQIAALESHLGVRLFHRIKKRVSLTEVGAIYAKQISEDLEQLERHTNALRAHRGGCNLLTIGVIPTFATRWLIPRLSNFWARHPAITLNLMTRADPFMFTDTDFNGAIHFGVPKWPGAEMIELLGEELIPLCSPALLVQRLPAGAASLTMLPLLHHSGRRDAWARWFARAGLPSFDCSQGPCFDLFSMLIEAALAGLGVALVPRFLAERELLSGELIVPVDMALVSPYGYYLAIPDIPGPCAAMTHFANWLKDEAVTYQRQSPSV